MLVRLTSSTSGDMVIYAEHLHPLFEIIGKECTARGVFTLEQLPQAIQTLQHAVDEAKASALQEENKKSEAIDHESILAADDENDNPQAVKVEIGQRAYPLIQLMARTLKKDGYLTWETTKDF